MSSNFITKIFFMKKRGSRPSTNSNLFHSLTEDQVLFLQAPFSREEIKRAVWECGSDRDPGPDGFSFGFLKRFWDFILDDLVAFVQHFHDHCSIPKGNNASFFTVIPKVRDPKIFKDFRPISLIGCQYKIIDKLLANRLVAIIGSIVSLEQSAFVKGRQILDGLFLLNELVSWSKATNHPLMIFKVDF